MAWLNDRLGQIIAGVTIAGTLAGFGYEGAQTINRIDNLENTTNQYIESVEGVITSMIVLEKQMVVIDEQLKSLDVPDIGGIEQDIAVLKEHGHPPPTMPEIPDMPDLSGIKEDIAGMKATISSINSDIEALKNKDDNPLAN